VAPAAIGASLAPRAPPTGARRAAPLRTAAAGPSLATLSGTCGSAGTASAACWRPLARPTAPACEYRIPVHAARGRLLFLFRILDPRACVAAGTDLPGHTMAQDVKKERPLADGEKRTFF